MKKLLSIFTILIALFAFLPSSQGVIIRASGVTVRYAPSLKSAVMRFFPSADLQVVCQTKGWGKITGLSGKIGWATLNGGKEIKGVPDCNAPPQPPKIPELQPPPISDPQPPPFRSVIHPELQPALGAPCDVSPSRQGIAMAATWATRTKQNITYSQDTNRWSGINEKACPFLKVPPFADSSSFVTWLFWTAFGGDRDFLHNQNWKGGNIETMRSKSFPISLSGARPGDVVFYGSKAPHEHVAVYVGNSQVVTFEANGPAKLLPISHCGNDYIVRSYLP